MSTVVVSASLALAFQMLKKEMNIWKPQFDVQTCFQAEVPLNQFLGPYLRSLLEDEPSLGPSGCSGDSFWVPRFQTVYVAFVWKSG